MLLGVLVNLKAIEGPMLHRGLLQLVRKLITQAKINRGKAIGCLTNNACASAVDIAEDNTHPRSSVESVAYTVSFDTTFPKT